MPNVQTEELPASLVEKLHFIRRTPVIFIAWLLFSLAVALIGWGALFANLRVARISTEQRILREAAALATTHGDRLTRGINGFDQIARHVRADWRRSGRRLQLEQMREEGVFPHHSRYFVTLVDRDGMPFTSTLPNLPQAFLGGRPYFESQKNAADDQLHFGGPLLSRMSGTTVVNLSRRLINAEGAFDGIVVISVPIEFFNINYDATVLGAHGLLAVASDDHALAIARIGENLLPPEAATFVIGLVANIPSGSSSAYIGGNKWFPDKRGRFVGWRAVNGYPLTALVGLDEADALAQYRTGRHSALLYAWWATAALAVLTVIAIRLSAELAWRNHRLNLSHATYRLATEEGSEGFYILQPVRNHDGVAVDFLVLDCNQQGAEFVNRKRQQLVGKTIASLSDRFDTDLFMNRLLTALEDGVYESEIEVPVDSAIRLRWANLKIIRSGGNLAVRLRDISQAKAHVKELKRRGDEDVLTTLPNRQWIQGFLPEAINRARGADEKLALLFIDLDGFKKVNDTAGHAAGDELLQHAAQRLLEAVRPEDKVARFGGDEFVVILENIEHRVDAAHVAERVQRAFGQPFRLTQGAHAVGASIGISIFPADGDSASVLLEKADIAMYSVKMNGKGAYQFYEAKFYHALRERLDKETEIRRAIERDEFVVYYQPRVDIATGITTSLEALVRWQHPAKGLLEPAEFITVAEETGLIVRIGEFVMDQVCAQLAQWAKHGTALVPVSVNVSPRQFNNADVADLLSSALERHNVPANLLELEITESSVMAEGTGISTMLAGLQKKGTKILVDDFGTGYSSLSQLHKLDFDILKVDQSFTARLGKSDESNVFYTAIVTMAHALGMRVVAEGVETLEQIEILKALQCDEIQGFYISKPLLPGDEQPILPKMFSPVEK
jgi:diguanylate cyclase (GGDEF)-like protein